MKKKVKVPEVLTPRESELFLNILKGLNNKAIAKEMGIAYDTAKLTCNRVLKKVGVHSKTELMAKFL